MITSYDTLPVGKYLDICAVSEDPALDTTARTVAYISILADMAEDEVLRLPIGDFAAMARQTAFLCKDADPSEVAKCYRLGKWELVPVLDFRRMTAGQYIDFQALVKDSAKHLVEILAVFLVPKGRKYGEGYEIDEVKEAIRTMLPLTAALALQDFFLRSLHVLIRASLSCSDKALKQVRDSRKRKELETEMRRLRRLLKNGDGSALSMMSARPQDSTGTKSSI